MSNGNDDDDIEVIGGVDPLRMAGARDDDSDDRSLTDLVEQPAKVMRIGTMIKQLLEEVRAAPLDDASRNRLRAIHATISATCWVARGAASTESSPIAAMSVSNCSTCDSPSER